MIDLETVENEINKIDVTCDTSFRACERLAWLYVVRDHLLPSASAKETDYMQGSEFLEAASGVSHRKLMGILDEHMSALSVVQTREYESIIAKIRALK